MRIKSSIKYLKILDFTLRTLRLCGRIISRKGAKFAKKELKRQLKFQPLIHIKIIKITNMIKLILTFALAVMLFSACESIEKTANVSPKTENIAAQNEIKQISIEQTQTAVKTENAQFIDVRTPEEYAGGHAPKTSNLPLDNLENSLSKLDKGKPVYIICQTGRRSQKGAEILQKAGFTDIYNINGGTSEWMQAGFPTEK